MEKAVHERLAVLQREKALALSQKTLLQNKSYIASLCTQIHLLQQRLRALQTQGAESRSLSAAPLATLAEVAIGGSRGSRGGCWVAGVFGDDNFQVVPNPGGGDCLFYAVGQAVGQNVLALRNRVASQATEEEYRVKKALYHSALQDLPKVQARIGSVSGRERQKLELVARDLASDISVYRWLASVGSLGEYRAALARRGNWGDAEAIGHLEAALGVKLLILSKCGRGAYVNTFVPEGFAPSRYIMIAYDNGRHYELVRYGGVGVFTAETLPPAVRALFDRECPQYARDIVGWGGVPVVCTKT